MADTKKTPAGKGTVPSKTVRNQLRDEGFLTASGEARVKVEYADNGNIHKIIVESKAVNYETGEAQEKYVLTPGKESLTSLREGMFATGELKLEMSSCNGIPYNTQALDLNSQDMRRVQSLGKVLQDAIQPRGKKKPLLQEVQQEIAGDIVNFVRKLSEPSCNLR